MKKRTLLAALLVVPMGAAFAWHEEQSAYDARTGKVDVTRDITSRIGRQQPMMDEEARLGTRGTNVTENISRDITSNIGRQQSVEQQEQLEKQLEESGF